MEGRRWPGRRFTYDVDTDKWEASAVELRIADEPFAEGGMRLAYRAREVLGDGDEVECVAKTFKPGTESIEQLTYDEVEGLEKELQRWRQEQATQLEAFEGAIASVCAPRKEWNPR